MGGFFKNNPEDTVVGSTDATEDTINETAVTETDSTSSFYRGSPEQTTVDGYVADAAGHASRASGFADDAKEHKDDSENLYNLNLGILSSSSSNSIAARDHADDAEDSAESAAQSAATALINRNNAVLNAQSCSNHANNASQSATTASDHASTASNHASTAGQSAYMAGQSATSASDSASSILNLTVATGAAGTSASYDAATGVLTIPASADGEDGEDGNVYIGSYDENTGKVNFLSNYGTNFQTDDLRGEDGSGFTGGSYDSSTGIATFTSDSGLGFSTSDLRGENGTSEGAVLADDFTTAGIMTTDGNGGFSVDASTYLTSFDITTQTDPKYLRSDGLDTATGFINFSGGIGVTGDLGISGDMSCRDLSLTGNVTFEGATTNLLTNNNNKNIVFGVSGTGGGGGDVAIQSSGIGEIILRRGSASAQYPSSLEMKSSGHRFTHTKPSLGSPVVDFLNTANATASNNSGGIIHLSARNTGSTGTIYTKGVLGTSFSPYVGAQYSSPYFAHAESTFDSGISCRSSGSSSYNSLVSCDRDGQPQNNKMSLGSPPYKWANIFATTSTIGSSDRQDKRDIEELTEAETRVAVACKGLLRKYRWKDAYEEKGEEARMHFGIMAQDLRDAFTAEGLDASKYAMFCSDTWWDLDGEQFDSGEIAPEGATLKTKLGVRYEELLAFIIAAI